MTTTVIITGDRAGGICFLDMPPSYCSVEPTRIREDIQRVPAARAAHVPTCTNARAAIKERTRSLHHPGETREARMSRTELLTRLSQLLPSQFEEVLFRANIPTAHLPGIGAPQTTRAIEAIRYLENQNQLEQLVRVLHEVAADPP